MNMKNKIIISLIVGIVAVLGVAGAALAYSDDSCDRYLVSWWGTHNPTYRWCSTDYYTYAYWGMSGANCQDMFDYASYSSWRSFTDADGEWTGSDEWDFYIPSAETSPVTQVNYYHYNTGDGILSCIGTINHYTAYGWTVPDCPCYAEGQFGECDCVGVAGWWDADTDRLITSDCGYPEDNRNYADGARVNW